MSADEIATGLLPSDPRSTLRAMALDVIDGSDRGAHVMLYAGRVGVGTAPANALRLHDPTVSRLHCELSLHERGARLVDLGSTNGTFVGGVRVRDADVEVGSTIRVGATTLRVRGTDDTVQVPLSSRESFGALVGASVEMRRVYALIERVAPTDSTVLIQGGTGTGKEHPPPSLRLLAPQGSATSPT